MSSTSSETVRSITAAGRTLRVAVRPGTDEGVPPLLLMNGIGLCATLEGLQHFLQHAKGLLQAGGQLLFDSSDVAYLYNGKPPKGTPYYG